jgi:hypothetical protein
MRNYTSGTIIKQAKLHSADSRYSQVPDPTKLRTNIWFQFLVLKYFLTRCFLSGHVTKAVALVQQLVHDFAGLEGLTCKKKNFLIVFLFIGPPLWSSGQSSCVQFQRSGFDYLHYQIFWELVGLERGPLSLSSTTEELLWRKSSGSGLENREYGRRDPSRCPRDTLYPQKLSLPSPTSGGRSTGIVRLRTQATECFFF